MDMFKHSAKSLIKGIGTLDLVIIIEPAIGYFLLRAYYKFCNYAERQVQREGIGGA